MKKKAFLFMLLAGVMSIPAKSQPDAEDGGGSYSYLTFEMKDGAKTSVPASSLTMTFNGTTLTAGLQTFVLSDLSKMYFTAADETTGIEEISAVSLDEAIGIFDLQGHKIPKEQMQKGVYIIKMKNKTSKIVVK